jgi:hypothetical protein
MTRVIGGWEFPRRVVGGGFFSVTGFVTTTIAYSYREARRRGRGPLAGQLMGGRAVSWRMGWSQVFGIFVKLRGAAYNREFGKGKMNGEPENSERPKGEDIEPLKPRPWYKYKYSVMDWVVFSWFFILIFLIVRSCESR